MFEIENSIPRKRFVSTDYPFDKLEVGQSFWVSPTQTDSVKQLMIKKNKSDKKFRSEAAENDGRRVWRVE